MSSNASKQSRFLVDAEKRYLQADRFERFSEVISGLILGVALSTLLLSLAARWLGRDPDVRPSDIAACSIVAWLPISWLIAAIDRLVHRRLTARKRRETFLAYLDVHAPFDDSRQTWSGGSLDSHPLYSDAAIREGALSGFAHHAIRRWHSYFAAAVALSVWLYVSWSASLATVPKFVVFVQIVTFGIGYLLVRITAWGLVRLAAGPGS